jgi:hypothetical protein
MDRSNLNKVGAATRTGIRGLVTLSAMVLLLTCCSGGGASSGSGSGSGSGSAAQTAPVITAFTAAPSVISAGQASQLAWSVTGADTLSLNGNPVSGGSTAVSPGATTSYTLTATNGSGSNRATVTVTVGPQASVSYGALNGADLGAGANLNGALPFPADNAWNRDVSADPVDPDSAAIIANIGLAAGLHPDFGAGLYNGAPIGIPYVVVAGAQPKVPVVFTAYGDESDPGPYPVPPGAPIEGEQADGSAFGGDRHVLVIDRDAGRLYEMGNSYPQPDQSWQASGGALFHLDSDNVRPGALPGWTSADAAGLPIFPGLARYEEAASGVIRHALRFTVSTTRKAYVPPATHWASSNTSADRPPMGMRVRLKASYLIPAGFSAQSRAILQGLKSYGMFVADNGSNWYISGAPDPRWDNDKLVSELGSVKGGSFEVLRMDGLVTP